MSEGGRDVHLLSAKDESLLDGRNALFLFDALLYPGNLVFIWISYLVGCLVVGARVQQCWCGCGCGRREWHADIWVKGRVGR